MDNELIVEKSWCQRNWKWIMIAGVALIVVIFMFSGSNKYMGDFARAYADNALYENAILKVKENKRAAELLGEVQPIDKMTIAEGSVEYSKDGKSVSSTITLKGSRGKAKMDITADKKGGGWKYSNINIRIKDPEEQIEILRKE